MPLEIKGLINPTNTSVPTAHLAEIHDGGLEPTDSFTVTKNLTHAVIRNEQITNTSYYANVEPETGWSGLTVTIKVGGVDMSNLYQSGTINIPKVTGNIVITAVAAQAPLSSITAVYTQSGTVYDTDSLDSLKSDLVVTANYEDGTSAMVSDYTLSGTLAEGTSTITVSYGGKTATFNVMVTVDEGIIYQLQNRTFANDGGVNTGLLLLGQDRSFTILCDADFAGQQSSTIWVLMKCMNPTSPYAGLSIQRTDPTANILTVQWMTGKKNINLANSYTGNVKIALTHDISSGTMTYYVKVGSNSVVSDTIASAYQTITTNVAVGGNLSGTQVWNGTINDFAIYDHVLDSTDIDEFMAG